MRKGSRLVAVSLAVLLAVCTLASVGIFAHPVTYSDRIYPGVSVHVVDVGGLTVEEATAVLAGGLPDPATQVIELRAGEQVWQLSWADAGQGYDYAGTAALAYQVARRTAWYAQIPSAWRVRLEGHRVEPLVIPADPARVVAALEGLAPAVSVPPVDAQLRIGPGGVDPSPGRAGRALDVDASAALVLQALADSAEATLSAAGGLGGVTEVELVTVVVEPRLSEPEPATTLARSLVAQPFTLVADDPLTDYRAELVAPPERVATWLLAVPEYTEDTARMALGVDEEAVGVWLDEIAPQLGPERLLDAGETLTRIVAALAAGEHQAQARIRHPEGAYVVQPGDNFFDIAYSFGFPQWRLEEANPDVDPEELAIGMELVIPSIDVLFPHPLAPGKRIEISLPEQRLRAYEDGQLVYDLACSSGMTSTPTIAGQFQVLFKEPSAYASRWSLEMPYFMAVYQEGPDFANGIHELPITSYGKRLWAGVLGWPASYGCIILDIGDAEALYNWAPVGTLVRITGVAPGTPVYEEGKRISDESVVQSAPLTQEDWGAILWMDRKTVGSHQYNSFLRF
jgi:hypothetical protein